MRNPGDEERRRIARAALGGDEEARQRLESMQARLGESAPDMTFPEWRSWAPKDVFIPWDELVEVLGLNGVLVYFDGSEIKTPNWVWDSAADAFDAWKRDKGYYEPDNHEDPEDDHGSPLKPLNENQAIEIRSLFSSAIEREMMPWSALGDKPALAAAEIVNRFATREGGVFNYKRELPHGMAVELVSMTTPETNPDEPIEKLGYTFRIYPPFITAYVEGCEWAGYGDEGLTLDNIKDGEAVFRVAKWLWDATGEGPGRNAADHWLGRNWDPVSDASYPTNSEIEKAIEDNKPKANPVQTIIDAGVPVRPFREVRRNDSVSLDLFHGSPAEKIVGRIRIGERDSGWFGSGFYLSAYEDYAKRWGPNVHVMTVRGRFAEVTVIGNYEKLIFHGDAEIADREAGGTVGWIENEARWSRMFTDALSRMGYDGVRVHYVSDGVEHKDVEVVVFDPNGPALVREPQTAANPSGQHFLVRSIKQGLDLINHPAIRKNFAKALRWRPKNKLAVLVPCAGTKPFPKAPSHKQGYLAALEGKDADLWVVSEPLGVVPYAWSETWPNNAYDYPPKFLRDEAWDALAERVAEWLEKVAPKYKKVFVALPGHHERLLRAALELHNPGNLCDATHSQCLDQGACPSGHGRATSTKYRHYLGAVVKNPQDENIRTTQMAAETAPADFSAVYRYGQAALRSGAGGHIQRAHELAHEAYRSLYWVEPTEPFDAVPYRNELRELLNRLEERISGRAGVYGVPYGGRPVPGEQTNSPFALRDIMDPGWRGNPGYPRHDTGIVGANEIFSFIPMSDPVETCSLCGYVFPKTLMYRLPKAGGFMPACMSCYSDWYGEARKAAWSDDDEQDENAEWRGNPDDTGLSSYTHALTSTGVPYAVVGGAAMRLHGFERELHDLDVLAPPESVPFLVQALLDADAEVREIEPGHQYEARLPGTSIALDLLAALPSEEATIADTVLIEGLSVVTLRGLVSLKLDSGREKDLRDVELIRKVML